MRIREHSLSLLEGLPGGFREHEEGVHEHGCAEDGEDEVGLVFNIDEGWWYKVAESEVEGPVGRGGKGYGLATDA